MCMFMYVLRHTCISIYIHIYIHLFEPLWPALHILHEICKNNFEISALSDDMKVS